MATDSTFFLVVFGWSDRCLRSRFFRQIQLYLVCDCVGLFHAHSLWEERFFRKARSVPVRRLIPVAVALVAVGLLTLWIIFPLLQKPNIRALSGRVSQNWRLYESGTTGGATAYLWFKSPPAVPSWTGWAVLSTAAILLSLTLVAYGRRPTLTKTLTLGDFGSACGAYSCLESFSSRWTYSSGWRCSPYDHAFPV